MSASRAIACTAARASAASARAWASGGAGALEPAGELGRGGERLQRVLGLPPLLVGFVAARREAGRGFLERREAGGDLAAPSLAGSRILARFFETTGGGAQRLAGVLFGRGGGGQSWLAPVRPRCAARRRHGARPRPRGSDRRAGSSRPGAVPPGSALRRRRQNRPSATDRPVSRPGAGRLSAVSAIARLRLASTRPIWASRRASAGGAETHLPSGSTPGGKAGSSAPSPLTDQWAGAETLVEASRSSPSAAPSAAS